MKPYYEHAGVTIYNSDCREVLPSIGRVDVVIADPPYGETSCHWDAVCAGWLQNVPTDNLWCFGSFKFFMANIGEFSGWKIAQDIIWEKQNGTGANGDRFNRVHELVVQFYRGVWSDLCRTVPRFKSLDKRSHRTKGRGLTPHRGRIESRPYNDDGTRLERSVQRVNNMKGFAVHPTQKPEGIISPLVRYSSPQDGIVLDPFCGSGTTLVVAKSLGRRAIGIEIEERYCEIAAHRLAQEVLNFGSA